MTVIKSPKKLIEVALPLDAINAAAAREKSIRHGHPSTLHLWWARRPLAAARAVIFAQMVNDPGYQQGGGFKFGVNKEKAAIERERLFGIIEKLVLWENTNNEEVLREAREEIWKSWRETCHLNRDHPQAAELFNPDKLPAFHDPFAGGGALPLEAQRLGLEAYASDLNPVAVTINKAMIEIPPRFVGRAPVGPLPPGERKNADMHEDWRGARGLAEDVRRYGAWMRSEAEKRIGHLYPKIEITQEMTVDRPDLIPLVGQKLTVIAWLWARTVKSPNPAFSHVDVPLASTFVLSGKAGKEAYVEPVIDGDSYRFNVRIAGSAGVSPAEDAARMAALPVYERAKNGTKAGKAQDFLCLLSGSPIPREYIRFEGKANRLGYKLMAVVAEGARGRIYLSPSQDIESIARQADNDPIVKESRETFLSGSTPTRAMITGGVCSAYGLSTWGHLFASRQLVALNTFSDLVAEAIEKCRQDYLGARASRPQKVWHSRGFLPHFEAGEIPQSITFRLHDSLPQSLLDQWRDELARLPEDQRQTERRKRLDAALDAGYGECWLRDPHIGQLVENAFLHFDEQRYRLHAWVVMPNHVHVLATPLHGHSLSSILHSWKSFTSKEANRYLGRNGAFWLEEYFDRAIRDDNHFNKVVEYIENNPVKAGLCGVTTDWRFSSACRGEEKRAGRPRSRDDVSLDEGGVGLWLMRRRWDYI